MENTTRLTDVELPQDNISPIVGAFSSTHNFQEAIENISSIIPDAPAIAASCTFFASKQSHPRLTQEEVAAINLYTIECDFYKIFNQILRERDRKKLIPFLPYLKYLLAGLGKLPSYSGKLWRGVKKNVKKDYSKGKEFFWWSFSSCTVDLEVLESEQFCGKLVERTIFCISSLKGKDIKMFSSVPSEGEVLLMPGYFKVKGMVEPAEGLTIIDLEELPPPFNIFIGIPQVLPVKKNSYEVIQKIGSEGTGDYQFNQPCGVAVDVNGNMIVTDKNNHRIQVFGSNGELILKFGSKGTGDGQFNCPNGVAIDTNGYIIVADNGNHRIQVFDSDGKFILKFGSEGNGDGQFQHPRGIAIDSNRNIIVADRNNHRIQVFESNGKFIEKFGTEGNGDGQLNYPADVAIGPNGNIVVVEWGNRRIQVFGKDKKFIQKFGSEGNGDGQFDCPYGVAIDTSGNIIVADQYNHRIQVFGANGEFIHKFGSKGTGDGQFNCPNGVGVAICTNGNIVIAEYRNNRIQVFG